MLSVALIGLAVTPRTFTSQTALERGLTESLPITRLQPQEFRNTTKPERRSLIEWVRLLNFNPEPDTYRGQKVKVQGFVIHPPNVAEQYMWIGRFIITCCAADAYPIGLPVKLAIGQSRTAFAPDSWLEIEGETIVEELQGKRKLIIQAPSDRFPSLKTLMIIRQPASWRLNFTLAIARWASRQWATLISRLEICCI
jgi:uncharacterized repeat protein (TIGR03943 family)